MAQQKNEERIDKFLWSVRLYKTRSKAAEACKDKKITVAGSHVKPSRLITAGDEFKVKNPPAYRSYKILQVLSTRVGAKLVSDYIEETTPPEITAELALAQEHVRLQRDKGSGRPTKKERRDLNRFFG